MVLITSVIRGVQYRSALVPPGQVSKNTLNFLRELQDPKKNDRTWYALLLTLLNFVLNFLGLSSTVRLKSLLLATCIYKDRACLSTSRNRMERLHRRIYKVLNRMRPTNSTSTTERRHS